ncbi:MAG: hypothetical protein QXG69_01185, partial [Candidatus Caldarchaeum sp.]
MVTVIGLLSVNSISFDGMHNSKHIFKNTYFVEFPTARVGGKVILIVLFEGKKPPRIDSLKLASISLMMFSGTI